MFKRLTPLIIFTALLCGCAADGRVPPPTPAEAKLIATSVMRLASAETGLERHELGSVRDILLDAKRVIAVALREDPSSVQQVTSAYLLSKPTLYAELANTVLGVLVARLRPVIDQDKTDLAGEYVESVIDGAVLAIDLQLAPEEST